MGVATPALAHCRRSAIGIQLGSVFIGAHRHRNCYDYYVVAPPVVVAPAPMVQAPPPPVVYSQPPMVYAQPAPVVVAPPPAVVYSNPPIVYAQPQQVVVQRPPPPQNDRPGFLAVKYMPGVSTNVAAVNGDFSATTPTFAHSPGLELRLTRWLSLRSDLEFRKDGRTWDMLGAKLSLLPNSIFKPYASVSFSGNENYDNPGKYSFGFAAAAGADLFLGKYFFIEAEARYRMTPGSCCSNVPAVVGVIGGGVAFF
ncbi:MAG: hypothetical protein U0228_02920 [Myxococcaceae bacterium]